MRLVSVGLENFRNYRKIIVGTDAGLILILGENASGKTNFLESIYFLSRLCSFRSPDSLLVRQQEDYFNLFGRYDDLELDVAVQIKPVLKRQFKLDGQKTKRGLWQSFSTILFVPNDLNIFHLGPLFRRKFLDETLAQTDQAYSADLESLEHVLKQKAAILEQIFSGEAEASQLDFWNEQFSPLVFRITNRRQELIDFLNLKLPAKINQLTGFDNQFVVKYKRTEAIDESGVLGILISHKEAEIRSGKSLIGPQRDDFTIEKDGLLNLHNSSRGELRTQILALKLLQAEYLTQTNKKPIILLDDVFSELDETRRTKLIENLSGHQIFITSTEEHHLPKIAKEALILKVVNNEIKSQ